MRLLSTLCAVLLAASVSAQVSTRPPQDGGGIAGPPGPGVSFPLLAPAGAVTAPSYSFDSGFDEMGVWRSSTNLLIQNKGVTPGTGRSRVTFGEENFSLNATRTENATHTGGIQCFDEGTSTMKCRVDVFDGTNTNTTKFEPTFSTFNKQIRASDGSVAAPSYSFSSESDLGCYRDGPDAMHCNTGSGVTNVGQMQIESGQVALRWRNGSAQNYGLIADSSATTLYYANVEAVVANPGGTQLRNTTQTILDLNASGPDFVDPGTKPTCDSTKRGIVFMDEGGAGVADTFEVCAKDAGDAYAWRALW